MAFFVNGLGGASMYDFRPDPVPGSQFRFTGTPGAQLIEVDANRMVVKLITASASSAGRGAGNLEEKHCFGGCP